MATATAWRPAPAPPRPPPRSPPPPFPPSETTHKQQEEQSVNRARLDAAFVEQWQENPTVEPAYLYSYCLLGSPGFPFNYSERSEREELQKKHDRVFFPWCSQPLPHAEQEEHLNTYHRCILCESDEASLLRHLVDDHGEPECDGCPDAFGEGELLAHLRDKEHLEFKASTRRSQNQPLPLSDEELSSGPSRAPMAPASSRTKRFVGLAFREGEMAFLLRKNIKTKETTELGPFRVKRKRGRNHYELELPPGILMSSKVHVASLKRAPENAIPGPIHIDEESQQPLWAVERVVNSRIRDGTTQYLVHWKGFDDSADSWEPAKNLNSVAINSYKKQVRQNKQSTKAIRTANANKSNSTIAAVS